MSVISQSTGVVLLAVVALTSELAAKPTAPLSQITTVPVYLLSEHDLGSGFKNCILSNGLQLRLLLSQVCPYPIKAPPFQANEISSATSSSSSRPVSVADASAVSVSKKDPEHSGALNETVKSSVAMGGAATPITSQGLGATGLSTPNTKKVSAPKSPMPQKTIADSILDAALNRCERIGFELGSAEFRSCASEQIRLLSQTK
ncbi:MAG: hypothetical protein CFE36_11230 [Sphingomonadaceae bacterium PASS1]|nr:MAG: hypothetical protein CFE36_11230 [Sphingomonadaceae bacterium PASS1]